MPTYTRNDVWRIKRCQTQLEKALDHLTRANGELRPKQFAELRANLQHATVVVENVVTQMQGIADDKPPPKQIGNDLLNLDDEAEAAE